MFKQSSDFTLFLEDMLKAVEKIDKYASNQSFDEFCKNDLVVDAVIRNFEVIEEVREKFLRK